MAESDESLEVIRLWQLPDDFFQRNLSKQWEAMKQVTGKPTKLSCPRTPCKLELMDDALVVVFFLVTLGGIWVVGVAAAVALITGSWLFKWIMALLVLLAVHPMPRNSVACRCTRLSLAMARYFTMEVMVDRSHPHMAKWGTSQVDGPDFHRRPTMTMACPHGVFNYGAFTWTLFSRWLIGWYQYTGATTALRYVPCMRYMDPFVWCVDADRKTIKKCLRPGSAEDDANFRGGMIGMVPDGILGAFKTKSGVDELLIGKKRGLMRIGLEEGATFVAAWFFGTNDMLTVVQDPFGLMEKVSRKIKAGLLGYYGRWMLPVPYRIPVTVAINVVSCEKVAAPTDEQVEAKHHEVYQGLVREHSRMRAYAGHPNKELFIR